MVLSVGFDPSFVSLGSTDERRPPEREQDSTRVTAATESEIASADRRQRLDSPESASRPTRIAFTAKFGPDSDGFPLQLVSGDQLRGAESNDAQIIVDNRISQDSQAALLQAQETRSAVADESQRQQDAAVASRRENNVDATVRNDAQASKPDQSDAKSGSFVDLEV